jgi:hypothetical protein
MRFKACNPSIISSEEGTSDFPITPIIRMADFTMSALVKKDISYLFLFRRFINAPIDSFRSLPFTSPFSLVLAKSWS